MPETPKHANTFAKNANVGTRRVSRIIYGTSPNTVPFPNAPPSRVVPYRLPFASRSRPTNGKAPSTPPVKL